MSVTQCGSENETLSYPAWVKNRTLGDDPEGSAESSRIRMIKKGKEKNLQGKKNWKKS